MRRTLLFAALVVLSTTSVFADEIRAGSTSVSAYLSDLGYAQSSETSTWSGGVGVGVEHAWTNRLTTMLSVGAERRHQFVWHQTDPAGQPLLLTRESQNVTTYPIDVMLRYHFTNQSRWTPYIGLGGRYVQAPSGGAPAFIIDNNGSPQLLGNVQQADRTNGEINAGVVFRITPRIGLQLDGKRLLSGDGVSYDPLNKASIGLTWRF
jgi:outer membrane protein W